jgi:hypothetical protein
MFVRPLSTLFALGALTCAAANAGVITGVIMDSQGNPVRNALFEFKAMSGGGQPIVTGGTTNVNGAFTTTVTPDGDYHWTITPLAAPLSRAVVTRLDNIVVGPTVNNLGTVTLQVGVQVTGRVTNVSHTPLVSVGMHFMTPGATQALDFTNNATDAYGNFNITVPYGECEIQIEPGPVPYYGGPGTAPHSHSTNFPSSLAGPISLGDLVMPVGTPVSGSVRRQSDNSAIVGLDFAWVNRATGQSMYIPHPITDSFGNFFFTSEAGQFDLHFLPVPNDNLVAGSVNDVTVPVTAQLGTIFLTDGVELKGRVRGSGNVSLADVSVTLVNHATQAPVFIGDVRTGVDGRYTVLVPSGTYDVGFSPPFAVPYGRDTRTNIVVSGNSVTVDSNPASLPFFTTTGTGTPGLGGFIPGISAIGGTPRLGNADYALRCTQGCGGAMVIAVFTQPWNTALFDTQFVGNTHLLSRMRLSGLPNTAGTGSIEIGNPVPNDPSIVGQTLHARFMVRDASADRGWARSVELLATAQP